MAATATHTPSMTRIMSAALFAGVCTRCRRTFRKNDPVFAVNGKLICVPCERELDGNVAAR